MNHLSADIPETVWWKQQALMEPIPKNPSPNSHQIYNHSYHHQRPAATARMFCGQNTAFAFNLNQEDDDEELRTDGDGDQFQVVDMKEPMFEKPLTPSDVGKLNRLVIPKQHAEKYFPLGSGGDSGGGEKGLLLSFEDESGKSWRFRYSYWNSSQSYVLTKGWSRYVKEKRLDAGDVVLFERHRVDGDRLFIGWRRRSAAAENGAAQPASAAAAVANTGGAGAGAGGWTQVLYSAHSYPVGPPIPYQPHCLHAAGAVVQSQTTTPKRLRLFGVNLECQPDHDQSEPSTPDGSPMSTSQGEQAHYNHQYSSSTNPHGSNQGREQAHMDINFSRDVNQMRYHRG